MQWSPHRILHLHFSSFGFSRHDAVVTTSDSPSPFLLLSASPVTKQWSPHRILHLHLFFFRLLPSWCSGHRRPLPSWCRGHHIGFSISICSSFGLSSHDAGVTTSDSPAPFVLLSASPVMMQWSPHRIIHLHLFFFRLLPSWCSGHHIGFSISICSSFGFTRHDAVVTTSDSPSPFVPLSASPVTMQWSPHRILHLHLFFFRLLPSRCSGHHIGFSIYICSSFGFSRHDAGVTTSDSPSPFVLLSASPVMMQWSPHRILQLHLFFFRLLPLWCSGHHIGFSSSICSSFGFSRHDAVVTISDSPSPFVLLSASPVMVQGSPHRILQLHLFFFRLLPSWCSGHHIGLSISICSSFGFSRHDAVVTTSDSPAPFVLLSASPVMMQWSPHRILHLHFFFFRPLPSWCSGHHIGFFISISSSFGLSRHDAGVTTSVSPTPFILLSASPVMMQWSPHRILHLHLFFFQLLPSWCSGHHIGFSISICSSFGFSRHDAVVTTSDSPSPFVLLSASPVMMQGSPHRILQLHLFFFRLLPLWCSGHHIGFSISICSSFGLTRHDAGVTTSYSPTPFVRLSASPVMMQWSPHRILHLHLFFFRLLPSWCSGHHIGFSISICSSFGLCRHDAVVTTSDSPSPFVLLSASPVMMQWSSHRILHLHLFFFPLLPSWCRGHHIGFSSSICSSFRFSRHDAVVITSDSPSPFVLLSASPVMMQGSPHRILQLHVFFFRPLPSWCSGHHIGFSSSPSLFVLLSASPVMMQGSPHRILQLHVFFFRPLLSWCSGHHIGFSIYIILLFFRPLPSWCSGLHIGFSSSICSSFGLSRHDTVVTTSDSPSTLFCSSFGLSRHDAVITTSDSPAPFVLLSASPVMKQWSPHRILQLHLFFFRLLPSWCSGHHIGFSSSICSSFGLSRHDAGVTTSDSPSLFVLLSAFPVMMQWSPHRILQLHLFLFRLLPSWCSGHHIGFSIYIIFLLLSASPVMMQWSPHRILHLHYFVLLSASPVMMQWSPHRILHLHYCVLLSASPVTMQWSPHRILHLHYFVLLSASPVIMQWSPHRILHLHYCVLLSASPVTMQFSIVHDFGHHIGFSIYIILFFFRPLPSRCSGHHIGFSIYIILFFFRLLPSWCSGHYIGFSIYICSSFGFSRHDSVVTTSDSPSPFVLLPASPVMMQGSPHRILHLHLFFFRLLPSWFSGHHIGFSSSSCSSFGFSRHDAVVTTSDSPAPFVLLSASPVMMQGSPHRILHLHYFVLLSAWPVMMQWSPHRILQLHLFFFRPLPSWCSGHHIGFSSSICSSFGFSRHDAVVTTSDSPAPFVLLSASPVMMQWSPHRILHLHYFVLLSASPVIMQWSPHRILHLHYFVLLSASPVMMQWSPHRILQSDSPSPFVLLSASPVMMQWSPHRILQLH